MTTLVQHGSWAGWSNADIYLGDGAAAAFLTAAHDYMAETGRPMPEIVEPVGGIRTVAQVLAMRRAFDTRDESQLEFYNMSRTSGARPSLTSGHIKGKDFDVATPTFETWLQDGNAPRYGLSRPLAYLGDNNHWEYTVGTETVALHVQALPGATTEETEMPDFQMFQATDNGGLAVGVGAGDWWCRPTPSAPLERMTAGQAQDAITAQGAAAAPFSLPYFHGKPGAWFIAAFAEDAVVHGYNLHAHPFLAAAPGTKLDDASISALAAEIEKANATDQQTLVTQLSSLISTLPAAVSQELGKQLLGQH